MSEHAKTLRGRLREYASTPNADFDIATEAAAELDRLTRENEELKATVANLEHDRRLLETVEYDEVELIWRLRSALEEIRGLRDMASVTIGDTAYVDAGRHEAFAKCANIAEKALQDPS